MTDIEQKALIERLRQRSNSNYMLMSDPPKPAPDRDCHAAADLLEQLLPIAQEFDDFRQEVSDAAQEATEIIDHWSGDRAGAKCLQDFIIHKPKPDPLVAAMKEAGWRAAYIKNSAPSLRAGLEALGLEIREKNDD